MIYTVLLATCMAAIPVFLWYLIIKRNRRSGMEFFFWGVFFLAMIFSWIWKIYAEDALFSYIVPFVGIFFAFVLVGMCIEYSKNIIVRFVGHNFFEDLDDVVDLSLATALGYTAMENIFVFIELFSHVVDYASPVTIVKEMLIRMFFILPIHLFCSGVFGYFYGFSLFAKPSQRTFWKKLFPHIQIIKGTLISVLTYGLFFYILERDYRISDIASLFGYNNILIDERILPVIAFGFSAIGGLYLFHKMEQHVFITETKSEQQERIAKEQFEKIHGSIQE